MAVAMGGFVFFFGFFFKQENILMRSTAFTWSPLSLSAVDKGDIQAEQTGPSHETACFPTEEAVISVSRLINP